MKYDKNPSSGSRAVLWLRTDIRTYGHTFVSIGKFANASATAFTKRICKFGAAFDTLLHTAGRNIQESYK